MISHFPEIVHTHTLTILSFHGQEHIPHSYAVYISIKMTFKPTSGLAKRIIKEPVLNYSYTENSTASASPSHLKVTILKPSSKIFNQSIKRRINTVHSACQLYQAVAEAFQLSKSNVKHHSLNSRYWRLELMKGKLLHPVKKGLSDYTRVIKREIMRKTNALKFILKI